MLKNKDVQLDIETAVGSEISLRYSELPEGIFNALEISWGKTHFIMTCTYLSINTDYINKLTKISEIINHERVQTQEYLNVNVQLEGAYDALNSMITLENMVLRPHIVFSILKIKADVFFKTKLNQNTILNRDNNLDEAMKTVSEQFGHMKILCINCIDNLNISASLISGEKKTKEADEALILINKTMVLFVDIERNLTQLINAYDNILKSNKRFRKTMK